MKGGSPVISIVNRIQRMANDSGEITEPTVQSSNILFTTITSTSLTVSWTPGNGSNRIVVVKAGSAVNSLPVDGNAYSANSVFGNGSDLGSGNFVVYSGSGNSVTITGLTADTVYHVRVFEFNGSGSESNYLTSTATGNPSSETTFTTQFQSVVSRANVLGYSTPSTTTQKAINIFIKARVADESFALMDALYIPALNNSALNNFATINYKTPASFQLSNVNACVYGVGGFRGDGVSAYLNTNYNPAVSGVNYTLDAASRGMYIRNISLGTVLDGLASGGGNANRSTNSSSTIQRVNQGTTSLSVAFAFSGTGYKGINRSSSSDIQCYQGLTSGARTATSSSVASFSQTILSANVALFSDGEVSMYFIAGNLTATQHNNINNDFITYLTAIGL